MSHFEEPKLSDDEEPPTEQDKRKKMVSSPHTNTRMKHSGVTQRLTSSEMRLNKQPGAPLKMYIFFAAKITCGQICPFRSRTVPHNK